MLWKRLENLLDLFFKIHIKTGKVRVNFLEREQIDFRESVYMLQQLEAESAQASI